MTNKEGRREQARQAVLEAMRKHGRPMTLQELARSSGFTVNALSSIVATLVSRGDAYAEHARIRDSRGERRTRMIVSPVIPYLPNWTPGPLPAWMQPRMNQPLGQCNGCN